MVADGRVDIYYQSRGNMEWDTAAGQAIVETAGGRVVDEEHRPLRCNKPLVTNGLYLCVGAEACGELAF